MNDEKPPYAILIISVLFVLLITGIGLYMLNKRPVKRLTSTTITESGLKEFIDEKYGIYFQYPEWMQTFNYSPIEGKAGWMLQDSDGNQLMEITVTSSAIDYIRGLYPDLSFNRYTNKNLTGWKSSYLDESAFYLMEMDGNNIWVIGRYKEFKNRVNPAPETIEGIVRSMRRPDLSEYKWKELKSNEFNISFKYPGWMVLDATEGGQWSRLYILQDSGSSTLVNIGITASGISQAREQYPEMTFERIQVKNKTAYKAGYDDLVVYVIERNDKSHIWIIVRLMNFNTNRNNALDILEKIVQSIN